MDTLAVVDMILEDHIKKFASLSPCEMFEELDELIDKMGRRIKIKRFRPRGGSQPFHTFEIHTEDEEILDYLNMIYLRKPIQVSFSKSCGLLEGAGVQSLILRLG